MGNFLSREQLLKDSIVVEEVDYRDGKILVREMSGATVQTFFEEKVIEQITDPVTKEVDIQVHMEDVNLMKIASVSIIDPETYEPMFTFEETQKLPFELTQAGALTALRITKFGKEAEEGEEPAEGEEKEKKS